MIDDGANRRIIVTRAVLALIAAAFLFASFAGMAVQAQSIMRTPNLNVAPRLPRINPSVGARVNPTGITRINPTITGKTVSISKTTSFRSVPRIGVRSTLPYARYSPNLYPPCSDGYRDGGCWVGRVTGDKALDTSRHRAYLSFVGTIRRMSLCPNRTKP